MGIRLDAIDEGESIVLEISIEDKELEMNAVIKKQLKKNCALIALDFPENKKLTFDNVQLNMKYCMEHDSPIVWRGVKVLYYHNSYILQTFSDGVRQNRRSSFRVGVSVSALMRIVGKGSQSVTMKDVSLTGFAITDRKMELKLSKGDRLAVTFDDLGFRLDLEGRVVRIEEREDCVIYGMEICNLCKDLAPYISVKQRRNRNK